MAGVLDGFKVIDFGQYIAGPLVGMLMADQGADVIKVDPPGGPRWKTSANATWNRGKRSIVLDLKDVGDLATAKELVQGADLVVENFRPGVMDRLGLGATAMTEAKPRLVYLSLPGFASDDPRASTPAWEGILGAATATYRPNPLENGSDKPVYTAIPISSNYGAFQGAVAGIMALISRERNGEGQRVEVPLFDATFASIGRDGMRVHNEQKTGADLRRIWGGHFECEDGRWVRFGGSGNQNLNQFVASAGISSWHAEGLTDLERLGREPDLAAELDGRLKELFKTRTAQAWEDLVAEAGSECTVCRTSEEWFSHPHALESKMVIEVQDPTYGKMLQPGINARMSLSPGEVRRPAPALDQHREEILSELASQRPATPQPSVEQANGDGAMGSVLKGIKVLDLCIILAGPTCGRTLAEYGADVIKIDNPSRGSTVSSHNEVNRAKRSILLDLKTEEGLNVFWRLLEDADVVAQNYRAGKLENLGIGYEEVRKRKPDIIYVSLNAFGHIGPWAGRPGHEGFAQATTGMDLRFGGDGPPKSQPNAINDYGTGFMGAYGVALALLHRERTGQGQHVDSALAYTAMIHQSPYMQLYQGKTWDETRGQDAMGAGPLHRAYQTNDGWLFVGAQETDLSRMAGVDGLAGIESLREDALASALEERFRSDNVQAWVQRLNSAGIGAHRVLPAVAELLTDPWVIDHGLSITREHDEIGLVTGFGPSPRLSRTPVAPGRPAPKPGAQGREILEEIGLGQEFDRLLEQGVILTDGVAAG